MFLAEGGVIPDNQAQDSGDAAPAQSDPFSLIQQALNFGRKKMGLPQQFYGTKPKPSNDANATNQAAGEEGSTGGLNDDNLRAFQNNQINNNLQPGEQGQWGDTTLEGKEKTAYLAEGGAIEDDTGTDDQQGVIPDGSTDSDGDQDGGTATPNGSSGQVNPQSAMAYLTGQGAVGPEVAAALERQVDPQGQMPESQRKLMAISQAGSPDKAFQVMQHYRQKFNAYTAFAKAALQGAGGRPPNPQAAADALNKAYAHVPDGTEMHFQAVPGGVQIASRKIIPSKPAPSGGEDNSQRDQEPTKSFAEGGSVDDDTDPMIPEQQPDDSEGRTMPQQSSTNQGPEKPEGEGWEARKERVAGGIKGAGDKVAGVIGNALSPTEGEAEGYKQLGSAIRTGYRAVGPEATNRVIKMGWDALMKAITSEGNPDKMIETQGASLTQGAQQGQQPSYGGTSGVGFGDADSNIQARGQAPWQQSDQDKPQPTEFQGQRKPSTDVQQGQSMSSANLDKSNPVAVGRQLVDRAAQVGASLKDIEHELELAYPMVGDAQRLHIARAAAKTAERERIASIEKEQTKGEGRNETARIAGGFGVQKAQLSADARAAVEAIKHNDRFLAITTKAQTAMRGQDISSRDRALHEWDATVRSELNNMMPTADIPAAMEALRQTLQPPQQQQQAPQQQDGGGQARKPAVQQPTEGTGRPPTSVPPPGMQYFYSASRNSWKLAPAQQAPAQ
jgi:hypothetical protein